MRKQEAAVTETPANELIAERIAGPETAALLGVPVGTVVEARHAITPLDGSPSRGRIISPATARRIKRRFLAQEE